MYKIEFATNIFHYRPAQKVLQVYSLGGDWKSYSMAAKCNVKIGQQVIWINPENRVFILGGFTQDNNPPYVWEFKLKTKKLVQLVRMDKGRMNFGWESFDGMIYIVGGLIQTSNCPTATWMRYIAKYNKFEEISLLNKKRQGVWLWEFNATYLYAFGGQRFRGSAKTSIERIKFNQMRISTYQYIISKLKLKQIKVNLLINSEQTNSIKSCLSN